MRDKIFQFGVAGFIAGIFFRSFYETWVSFPLFLLVLSATIFLTNRFFQKDSKILLLSVLVFTFSLGILRFELKEFVSPKNNIDNFVGEKVIAVGFVSEYPDKRENSQKITIDLKGINVLGEREVKVDTKILVSSDIYSDYEYGDELKIIGILKKPENFDSGNGRIFDYESYLAKDGIFYQFFLPKIEVVSKGNGFFVKKWLFVLKNKFESAIERAIKEPRSSLLDGILLGSKHSLSKNLQEDFMKAGIIHIVVLSGYNITIVAESVMRALSFLPRVFSFYFGALGIILFAVMVGGGATVIRASIMALLVVLARAIGRNYNITRALIIAGVFMLIQNPKILVFDPSFQLSFMATLGLVTLSPLVEKKLFFITEKFQIRELVVSTISTQIFVLPLLLYMTGNLSLVSLPVNFLILAFIPATMFFGFLTGVFGLMSYFLSLPFAYLASILLSYTLSIVDFWSSFPFASVNIPPFSFWALVFVYAIYALVIFKTRKTISLPE